MLRRSPKPPKPPRARGSGHGARPVAVIAELVALGLGVAANLASVWDERAADPAQVWAGGAIPAVLLLATYLFLAHRVPVVWNWNNPGWVAWYANLISGAAILVPAAMASYWHQRELLLGWDGEGVVLSPGGPLVDVAGTPALLATLLPLTVDGLAVRAALTLWARPHDVPSKVGAGGRPAKEAAGSLAPLDGWGPADTAVDTSTVRVSAPTPAPVVTAPVPTPAPAGLRAVAPRRSPGVPAVPGWTRDRARARCAELGVSQRGTVAQLVARIAAEERERAEVPA